MLKWRGRADPAEGDMPRGTQKADRAVMEGAAHNADVSASNVVLLIVDDRRRW